MRNVHVVGSVPLASATEVFQTVAAALGSTLKRLPKMLMDRDGPLTIHPPSLPALLPWMARFARAAYSQAEVKKGVDSFGLLMAEANIAWKAEIQASGLGDLFKTQGALYVYESEAAFASGEEERALQKAKGTEFEIVDGPKGPQAGNVTKI